MSSSNMVWTDSEELALTQLQVRLQPLVPGRTLTRPDVVRVLVQAAACRMAPEEFLVAAERGGAP